MPGNQTFALWIIPTGGAHTLTSGYIAKLSSAYGLPLFEPHVTLQSGVRSPEPSELHKLSGSLKPFQIRLVNEVEYQDEYFRCLFIRAYQTTELMEAFSKASQIFGFQGEPYFPHLSLAYGDLPVDTKLEMIRGLGLIPQISFEARAISLIHVSTEMQVSSWEVVDRYPLGQLRIGSAD